MKYQSIYQLLAELARIHKVFLHYNSAENKLSDNSAEFKPKKSFRIALSYNLELLSLLTKLEELGFLTYKIYLRTVIIDINITSYSKIIIHSRPSRQIFKKVSSSHPSNVLWTKDNGLGLSIIRTSKGFLTTIEAKKLKIGGELLFSIL